MPSDPRVPAVLALLAPRLGAFRSTLAQTAEEVGRLLAAHDTDREARIGRMAHELGPFATGRIAVDRFAEVFGIEPSLDGAAAGLIRRAHQTLLELLAQGDELFTAQVAPGGSLHETVAGRLAHLGRAFAAARLVRQAQRGQPLDRHAASLERFPFARWSRAERELAPPLVIALPGTALLPASLAEFLDGAVTLVLVVSGEAPPAALVRLIAPGTYVVQATEPAQLEGLARWSGPGIGALVGEQAARFVHDPAAGPTTAQRLKVLALPAQPPRQAIGGISAAQQAQELAQLASLAEAAALAPAGTAAPTAPAQPSDPVEQLAAWLLAQAELGPTG